MTLAPTPMETTPEQAAVWGLSSPLSPIVSTPPRQGQSTRPRAPMAQQNKFRKGMGRGAGKAAQPRKRTRGQDEEGALDGHGSTRRGDHSSHPALAGESGSPARTAVDLPGSGQELRPVYGNGKPWNDQHDDSGKPGLAPTVRGRHGDHVAAGNPMGRSTARMASQAQQDRRRRPCLPRALQTAEAASWIAGVHGVECRTEEGPAIEQGQPHPRQPADLLRNTAKDGVVRRFQSLKPLRPDLRAEVMVILLTLTVHQQAAEVY